MKEIQVKRKGNSCQYKWDPLTKLCIMKIVGKRERRKFHESQINDEIESQIVQVKCNKNCTYTI